MRLAGALIALQERLPRLGDPRLGGTPLSRPQAWAGLAAFGLLSSISAVYVARHAGSPELLLQRYPGLQMLSFSLAWVGLIASELLRRGSEDGRPSAHRVASAALAAVTWLVLIPAFLVTAAVRWYDVGGAFGVLAAAVLFAFFVGLLWLVRRYSGPVRRRPGP